MTFFVNLGSWFIIATLAGMIAQRIWNSYLSWRNKTYIAANEEHAFERVGALHESAKTYFTQERLTASLKYFRTLSDFGVFSGNVLRMFSLVVLVFGIFPMLFNAFFSHLGWSICASLIASLLIFNIVETLINLPFSMYETFKIESKFNFNNTTLKQYAIDVIKSFVISTVTLLITITLVQFAVVLFHTTFGQLSLMHAVSFALVFILMRLFFEDLIAQKIILPLFNKLTPLPDGELKTKVEAMLTKFGFNPKGIFVIDQSKRSSHDNAYCTGWGRSKKIVIYDTMLSKYTTDEILAVIAHELAHAKLHHILISRTISGFSTIAYFAACVLVIYNVGFFHAFGWTMVTPENVAMFMLVGFSLFQSLVGSWSWVLSGLDSWLSRKHEFAADKYSCEMTSNPTALITCLFKLTKNNLSYPLVDPLFEAWHYSHPSLIHRIEAIASLKNKEKKESI